jgi:hypothetical protein
MLDKAWEQWRESLERVKDSFYSVNENGTFDPIGLKGDAFQLAYLLCLTRYTTAAKNVALRPNSRKPFQMLGRLIRSIAYGISVKANTSDETIPYVQRRFFLRPRFSATFCRFRSRFLLSDLFTCRIPLSRTSLPDEPRN